MEALTISDNEIFLRQKSVPVSSDDFINLKKDIKILESYCEENEVMAIASIQLGIPKRLIYIKNTNLDIINNQQASKITKDENRYNEARILINPIILKKERLTEYWEACASCLNNVGRVKRPYKILVEYLDIFQKKHLDFFEGFESTVLSHEMDHLDGVLHMDIAEKLVIISKNERKKLRQKEGYKVFFKYGDYEKLKIQQ